MTDRQTEIELQLAQMEIKRKEMVDVLQTFPKEIYSGQNANQARWAKRLGLTAVSQPENSE